MGLLYDTGSTCHLRHGFFLQQEGQDTPYLSKSDSAHFSYYSSYGITVEIPSQLPSWAIEAEDWTAPRSVPSPAPRSVPSPAPRSVPSPAPRTSTTEGVLAQPIEDLPDTSLPDAPEPEDNPDPMDLNLAYWIQDLCYQAKAKQLLNSSEPTSWKQVLKSDNKDQWISTIFSEFQQLIQAGVFYFIPLQEIPTGRRLLKSRLVLRVKKDQQNNPIKFKARLVAKGFMQIEGLDYIETFATTSIPPTWRILLALAAQNNWYVEQIDFIGAFLNSELPEVNYLEIPEGLEAFISYNPAVKQGILLKKALYGLKQGPREWQEALAKLLHQYGYSPLVSDPAIYYNSTTSTYIVSHVDDCLLIGPNLTYINKLKQQLHKVYPIEDRGQAAFFLGVQISRTTKGITLSQKGYIEEALSRFGSKEAKAVAIPLQPGVLKQATATPLTPLSATDQLI
ncbi:hypothetical protein RJ55_06223 [Drechmeria coniospora]|nr:hypothetical protein RJ55_06223 [Drechmeria coniospora]